MDRLSTAFLVWLAVTVVALGGVVWSGARRRRHLHYALVVAMFGALALAIREAGRIGRALRFDGAAAGVHAVHTVAVVLTFALAAALVVTGVRLARSLGDDARRRRHRVLAFAFVATVVATCALGVAMTALAEPRV